MMRKFGIIASLCLMLLGFCGNASAQTSSDRQDMRGRMVYGGNFGFGLHGSRLSFSIAPQVGYRILSPWEIGVRGIYNLNCYFDKYVGSTFRHYFGVAPYTNVEVYRGLFLHVEDEIMYGIARYQNETVSSKWFNSVFVGAGYRQYAYNGSFVYFMVLYNLSWSSISTGGMDTPYAAPFAVRVGYCF